MSGCWGQAGRQLLCVLHMQGQRRVWRRQEPGWVEQVGRQSRHQQQQQLDLGGGLVASPAPAAAA